MTCKCLGHQHRVECNKSGSIHRHRRWEERTNAGRNKTDLFRGNNSDCRLGGDGQLRFVLLAFNGPPKSLDRAHNVRYRINGKDCSAMKIGTRHECDRQPNALLEACLAEGKGNCGMTQKQTEEGGPRFNGAPSSSYEFGGLRMASCELVNRLIVDRGGGGARKRNQREVGAGRRLAAYSRGSGDGGNR